MFESRKSTKKVDLGSVITQPNQAFTVRQIIDQFARGELIPSMYEPTDFLGDDVDDDDMENIIEFEDKIDAEGHLLENQYKLYEDGTIYDKESTNTEKVGESSDSTSTEIAG